MDTCAHSIAFFRGLVNEGSGWKTCEAYPLVSDYPLAIR